MVVAYERNVLPVTVAMRCNPQSNSHYHLQTIARGFLSSSI